MDFFKLDPRVRRASRLVETTTPEYPKGCVPVTGPPPEGFHFPKDLGNHPQQAVEWWWYLGNFEVKDGGAEPRRFGAELCFLRKSATCPPDELSFMLASLAVADVDANKLLVFERGDFLQTGAARIKAEPFVVAVNEWRVEQTGDDRHLRMVVDAKSDTAVEYSGDRVAIDLDMLMVKDNALTGKDGYDGNVHLAQPRITADGFLTINDDTFAVTGIFWVEHQWLTPAVGGKDPVWNWFAFQFDDGTELTMGIVHPVPTDPEKLAQQPLGCHLDVDGKPTYIMMNDLVFRRSHPWTSPRSGIVYPGIVHDLTIPSLGYELHVEPFIEDNEVTSRLSSSSEDKLEPLYYEGASRVTGTRNGVPVKGVGYTELVGFE